MRWITLFLGLSIILSSSGCAAFKRFVWYDVFSAKKRRDIALPVWSGACFK